MIWVKINFAIYIETNEEKFKNQGNFFFMQIFARPYILLNFQLSV